MKKPGYKEHTVLHVLSGDLWGGAEAQICYQLAALNKTNWNVQVLLFNKGKVLERLRENEISCQVVEERYGFLHLFYRAAAFLRQQRPFAVVTHGYKSTIIAIILCRILKIPVIVTFHGLTENLPGFSGVKLRVYQAVERILARNFAHKLVAVSNALVRDLGFSKLKQVEVINNVIEFDNDEKSVISDFNPLRPTIVFVGRLVPVKRLDLAIQAMSKLLQHKQGIKPHFYILGEGSERTALEGLVKQLGLCEYIHFCGFRTDAKQIIKMADLLLLSSDSEGLPTVLLEAISSGIPVVATNVGGIPEVAESFKGYPIKLVAAGDATSMAEEIREMLNIGPISQAIKEKSSQIIIDQYSPRAAVDKHERLYMEILATFN